MGKRVTGLIFLSTGVGMLMASLLPGWWILFGGICVINGFWLLFLA
ncbi:MAG: hypothetical protein IJ583_12455 [Firmicutes bacterium]|nr:hypothetical protein [Bacillota bacterium]